MITQHSYFNATSTNEELALTTTTCVGSSTLQHLSVTSPLNKNKLNTNLTFDSIKQEELVIPLNLKRKTSSTSDDEHDEQQDYKYDSKHLNSYQFNYNTAMFNNNQNETTGQYAWMKDQRQQYSPTTLQLNTQSSNSSASSSPATISPLRNNKTYFHQHNQTNKHSTTTEQSTNLNSNLMMSGSILSSVAAAQQNHDSLLVMTTASKTSSFFI